MAKMERSFLLFIIASTVCSFQLIAQTAPRSPEPTPLTTVLLPGRIVGSIAFTPSGEAVMACEDRNLYAFSPTGTPIGVWTAPQRFSGSLSLGPEGTDTERLIAVGLISGVVSVVSYDPEKKHFDPIFSSEHPSPLSAEPAWDPQGDLYLSRQDGTTEAWSRSGDLLWRTVGASAVIAQVFDESAGLYLAGASDLRLIDRSGKPLNRWDLPFRTKGMVQSIAGDLYFWNDDTVFKKGEESAIELFFQGNEILGLILGPGEAPVVTAKSFITRFSVSGEVLKRFSLPHQALAPVCVDDRGRLFVPTRDGLEEWTLDGRFLQLLAEIQPVTSPSISSLGDLAFGGRDWKIRIFHGFPRPPYTWSQFGGSPGKSFLSRRPTSLSERLKLWSQKPDFIYLNELASSPDRGNQAQALSILEAKSGSLQKSYPYANLILLKIVRSGLTDLVMDRGRILNSWPENRARAFRLLAETASLEDRQELLDLLSKEYDSASQAVGILALAKTGWDGDGKLMRLLTDLQRKNPNEVSLASNLVDAARTVWRYNGQSTDPSLATLVTALFQGSYPRVIRTKAQELFQEILDTP